MKPVAFAALSAFLFAAALPSDLAAYGIPLLGVIALVPLYFAIRLTGRMRTALWAGGVFGALSTVLSNYWLANFGEFALWTIGGPTLGYAVYHAALASVLFMLMRLPAGYRPAAFAVAWTGYELLKSIGYLGYPWGLAAYAFGDVLVLLQISDLTGVYGLSFLVAYANAALAEFLFEASGGHGARRHISGLLHVAIATALFLTAAGYGHARLAREREPRDTVRVVLVQPNTDPWQIGTLEGTLSTLQRLSTEALAGGDHDLLVWSETSLSLPYSEYRNDYFARVPAANPFAEFVETLPVPLLSGAPYVRSTEPERIWNAVILIEPESGEILERYGKRRLVPFAEHVPFWDLAPVRSFFRNVVGLSGVWSQADETIIFRLPSREGNTTAGVLISFEGAFAALARDLVRGGASLLINMTNNSWSQTESAQYQQFVVTRFRAVEARRPLIISTVSGLTAVLDVDGRKTASLAMFEEGVLSAAVPIYASDSITVYHRIGDVFGWANVAAAAALFCVAASRRQDRRGSLPL